MADIMQTLTDQAANYGWRMKIMQSNQEGVFLTSIEKASDKAASILSNLAAYAHTSVALRDAIAMFEGPKVEVHLSNNDRREEFRRMSMTAGVSDGSIVGFGTASFSLGLYAMRRILLRKDMAEKSISPREAISGDF